MSTLEQGTTGSTTNPTNATLVDNGDGTGTLTIL